MTVLRSRRLHLFISAVLIALALSSTPATAAASHQQIEGDGSSWATNALNVWIANVKASGLRVVFTSTGSATGRKDFGNQTTDFAVSDIGYQGKDPQTGQTDLPCKLGASNDCRGYAYLPIVSGGTSFPYHIEVGGQLVRNLRLSGQTLANIFLGQIKNWNDPAITKDNNGHALPSLPIIPVNHAEGSGSSAQFSAYLDSMYPSIWRGHNGTGKPGETEYFPSPSNGIQQTGSDGVINFITSAAANGAIGYDEYSYALAKNYPVAKVENAAGYYTLPTQFNVAVALQKAQINNDKSSPDYLLQNLSDVYRYTDPRTYALSSYSYMIIPTDTNDSRMNTAKRQTLADFISYSVCDGQAQVGPVGYSSLPLNLVQASFGQLQLLKKADSKVDLTNRSVTSCNNPTFVPGDLKANKLAQIAPKPPACDHDGAGPCTGSGDTGVTGVPVNDPSGTSGPGNGTQPGGNTPGNNQPGGGNSPGNNHPGTSQRPGAGGPSTGTNQPNANGSGSPGANSAGGTQPGGNTSATAGAAPGANGQPGAGGSAGTSVDPDTGQVVDANANSGGGPGAVSVPVDLASSRQRDMTTVLAPLAALLILTAIALPPIFYAAIRRRRAASS